jgi:hypothetical protein
MVTTHQKWKINDIITMIEKVNKRKYNELQKNEIRLKLKKETTEKN